MGTTVVIEGAMASELPEAWRQLAALSGLMRLIDSDVIVWNWRSREAAATLLAAEPFATSAVTGM